jgi:hypothetical protein
MEVTDPMVLAALREQEAQRVDGVDYARPALYALQRVEPPDLLALVRELRRSARVHERELAARLIGQSPLSATAIATEVRDALECEEEPEVVCQLVWALVYAPAASMLPELERLAAHHDDRVRFPVPDALSRCAPRFEAVETTIMQLSSDPDEEVRNPERQRGRPRRLIRPRPRANPPASLASSPDDSRRAAPRVRVRSPLTTRGSFRRTALVRRRES